MHARAPWRAVAAVGLSVFVAVVASQGLALAPSFDPVHQDISEYVYSSAGVLIVVGFLAWALSWIALAAASPGAGLVTLQRAAFVSAAIGLFLVACFPTDRGALRPGVIAHVTTAGRVHDGASALITVSVTVAVLTGGALRAGRIRALSWGLAASAFAADLLMLAFADPVPGIRQRVLVGAACLWQGLWLATLSRPFSREVAPSRLRTLPGKARQHP